MSRFFSTTASAFVKFFGFNKANLQPEWEAAVDKFTAPGGSAEAKLGKLKSVNIKARDNNPVHKSAFNPADQRDVISVVIEGEIDKKTCHIFKDGKGTLKKGDTPS